LLAVSPLPSIFSWCLVLEKDFVLLNFSSEEKRRAEAHAQKVIDLLRPLPAKIQWLVVSTLYDTFPKNALKQEAG